MSEYDWIIEVLGDIIEFADKNNLTRIKKALLDAEFIASAELQEGSNVHYLRAN